MKRRYGFFPGCVMPAKWPWAEKAILLTAKRLGLNFDYLRDTVCCARPGVWKVLDKNGWIALTSYNLALAREQEVALVDSCNGCWLSHFEVNELLRDNPALLAKVNEYLSTIGKFYDGSVEVKHWLQILNEDVGLKEIQELVKRPLRLRVVRHVGCHARKLGDDVLPRYFDEILEALGVEIIDTPYDRMCCGLLLFLADPQTSIKKRAGLKLKTANTLEVDAVVLTCSGCFDQFSRAITLLREEGDLPENPPILHLAELLALAFGFSPSDFGMIYNTTGNITKLRAKLGK